MPETHFEIVWPDGRRERCYSPSLIIKEYFQPQTSYELADFMNRSRAALEMASERVRRKFGVPCSLAQAQLASIEARGAKFHDVQDAQVRVESFHE